MSGLVTFQNFLIVPKEMEGEFVMKVLNHYYENTVVGIKGSEEFHLTNETKISDQMVDTLNEVIGNSIDPEMPAPANAIDDFGYFLHDIVLVMERLKLSYQLDDNRTFHNLPVVGVW